MRGEVRRACLRTSPRKAFLHILPLWILRASRLLRFAIVPPRSYACCALSSSTGIPIESRASGLYTSGFRSSIARNKFFKAVCSSSDIFSADGMCNEGGIVMPLLPRSICKQSSTSSDVLDVSPLLELFDLYTLSDKFLRSSTH